MLNETFQYWRVQICTIYKFDPPEEKNAKKIQQRFTEAFNIMSILSLWLDVANSSLTRTVLLVSSNKVPPPHPPFSLSETHYHRNDTKPSRYNLSDKRDRIYIHYIPIFTPFYVTDSLGTTVESHCNCLCNCYYI